MYKLRDISAFAQYKHRQFTEYSWFESAATSPLYAR